MRKIYDYFNHETVNAILSFYANIKTLIQKKNVIFSLESLLLGINCEVSYHDGSLSDVIIGYNYNFDDLCKNKLIETINNSHFRGIPQKINEHGDVKVRGIITLNKSKFKEYFNKNYTLFNTLLSLPRPLHRIDPIQYSFSTGVDLDACIFFCNFFVIAYREYFYYERPILQCAAYDSRFSCLMFGYPYTLRDEYLDYKRYKLDINTDLYEFIAIETTKDNQQSPEINEFTYYSKYLKPTFTNNLFFCEDYSTIIKKDFNDLKGILKFLQDLVMGKFPYLCVNSWRLTTKDSDEVIKKELPDEIVFNFNQFFDSMDFNPQSNNIKVILKHLVTASKKSDSFENTCNNYKTIYSIFDGFSENNGALGDLGETIAAFLTIVSNEGYYPLKQIDLKSISKPESTKRGIDLFYERINPQTKTKEWLVIEVKVNKSRLRDGQATKQWVEEQLDNDDLNLKDIEKSTEIKIAYNKDPSCLKVLLLRIDLSPLQKKLLNTLYNTPIKISLSKLNDNAKIEQTESIETKLTVQDLVKKIDKFKNIL